MESIAYNNSISFILSTYSNSIPDQSQRRHTLPFRYNIQPNQKKFHVLSTPIRRIRIQAKLGDFASPGSQPFDNIEPSTTPQIFPPNQPNILDRLKVLWQFSRPHTMYGSMISVISILTVSFMYNSVSISQAMIILLTALIPALLINIYIVGLNQLYDIEIDKINKPFLPLAAGSLTISQARLTIISTLITGISFCFVTSATSPLRIVLLGSAILGTLYSAPPARLKRFPLLASIAILTVRGLLVNLGFFAHASMFSNLGEVQFPGIIKFSALFFVLYGIVIALLKDAPDIKGDRRFGIYTFSVRLGAKTIFKTCAYLLVTMFIIASIAYGMLSKSILGMILGSVSNLLVGLFLYRRAEQVDTESSKEISEFYMLSWKTFYLEYLLLPLATVG